MTGKQINGPDRKTRQPNGACQLPAGEPPERIEFVCFLTLQGEDATTNADAGHKKISAEDGRGKREDGIRHAIEKFHFSILHLLSSLFYLPGVCPVSDRLRAVRSARVAQGKKLLERGDYAGAVAQLKTATTFLATNAQAWNYLGVACQYAGQTVNAVAAYKRALDLDRDLMEAHYNLGCLWLEQNKPDAAGKRVHRVHAAPQQGARRLAQARPGTTPVGRSRGGGKKFQAPSFTSIPTTPKPLNGFGTGPN